MACPPRAENLAVGTASTSRRAAAGGAERGGEIGHRGRARQAFDAGLHVQGRAGDQDLHPHGSAHASRWVCRSFACTISSPRSAGACAPSACRSRRGKCCSATPRETSLRTTRRRSSTSSSTPFQGFAKETPAKLPPSPGCIGKRRKPRERKGQTIDRLTLVAMGGFEPPTSAL